MDPLQSAQPTDAQKAQIDAFRQRLEPCIEAGELAEALEILDTELAHGLGRPGSDELVRGAMLAMGAEILVDLEEAESALEHLEEALVLGWITASVYRTQGWAWLTMESFEEALDSFDQALSLDEKDTLALHGQAMALVELEEYPAALEALDQAIALDQAEKSRVALYALRSEVHLFTGDSATAERDLVRARDLDPEDEDLRLDHTRILVGMGQVARALEVLDPLASSSDAPLAALLLRSHLRLLEGHAQLAVEDAMSASNRYPDEAFGFVQLAHVQLAKANVTLAIKAAERAVHLDPTLTDAYLVRAAARQLKGLSAEAREDFERARQAPMELPHFLLGSVAEAMGEQGYGDAIWKMFEDAAEGPVGPGAGAASAGAQTAGPGGAPGFGPLPGGMGGMDPMAILGQLFDDQGNMRGPLKPFFEMALRNAPRMMKNMPPEMIQRMGGIDPKALEDVDLSNLSSEQIEEQMRQLYRMLQSGQNPLAGFPGMGGPKGPKGSE